MSRDIELNIDEIVIDGFADSNPDDVRLSIESELRLLINERGIPKNIGHRSNGKITPNSFNKRDHIGGQQSIGFHVAREIYSRL